MGEQPVPDVTTEDVFRVVKRDYSPTEQQKLLETIERIDIRNKSRIALACLKLGNGALPRAIQALDNALVDARDVIAAAEYPNYSKKVVRIDDYSAEELQLIYTLDWEQYSSWLYDDRSPNPDDAS